MEYLVVSCLGRCRRRVVAPPLRHAVHLFAEKSLQRCAWAELYYRKHREKEQSHANALRRLGQRWLKIIHKMWLARRQYDAELHHKNQLKRGSWIFQLKALLLRNSPCKKIECP